MTDAVDVDEAPYPRWPLVVLAITLALLVVVHFTNIDLELAAYFYRDGEWWLGDATVFRWFYDYGPLPGNLAAIGGLLVLIASLFYKPLRRHRRVAAFLALVMIIGPGLLINVVFKDNYGRPRPRETIQFGGEYEFVPVGIPGTQLWLSLGDTPAGKSFPSGHASSGFFLLALYFPLRRRFGRRAELAIVAGIGTGLAMGVGRMAQGAHYFSDVLSSGVMVALTAMACWWWVNRYVSAHDDAPADAQPAS